MEYMIKDESDPLFKDWRNRNDRVEVLNLMYNKFGMVLVTITTEQKPGYYTPDYTFYFRSI